MSTTSLIMSCTLCWISITILLSTVVPVTGRKTKRTVEVKIPPDPAPASLTIVTISPTTNNPTIMTEPQTETTAATNTDETFKKDEHQPELCEGQYEKEYCLNGGTCFLHMLRGEPIFYDCVCNSPYHGPRCEYKMFEDSLPAKPRRKGHYAHHRIHRESSEAYLP